MGLDAYAYAAWGIRATYGELRKTFKKSRAWIGPKGADQSHDFDPKTGKPNYEARVELPAELEAWEIASLDPENRVIVEELGEREVSDKTECVVVLESCSTDSFRSGNSIVRIPEAPSDKEKLASFEADTSKLIQKLRLACIEEKRTVSSVVNEAVVKMLEKAS